MPVRLLLSILAKIPKIPKNSENSENSEKCSKLDVLTTGANSLQFVHGLLSFVRNVLYSVLSGCGTVRTMVRRKVESFCAGTGRWQDPTTIQDQQERMELQEVQPWEFRYEPSGVCASARASYINRHAHADVNPFGDECHCRLTRGPTDPGSY